ncbi:MAG: carboxymuconolactone decarboxylase family protein [Planctomycetota bacterium]
MQDLKQRLPETAKDLKLNLGSITRSEHLNQRQLYGTLVATGLAARNAEVLAAVEREATAHLTPEDLALAKSIASTMGMNNVYYRFAHLVEDEEYLSLPARLRMQALGGGEDDRLDRELWALAVSAVNGCGMCIQSHERVLREHGATKAQIQDAVRIAAVVTAVSAVLDAQPNAAPSAA